MIVFPLTSVIWYNQAKASYGMKFMLFTERRLQMTKLFALMLTMILMLTVRGAAAA